MELPQAPARKYPFINSGAPCKVSISHKIQGRLPSRRGTPLRVSAEINPATHASLLNLRVRAHPPIDCSIQRP